MRKADVNPNAIVRNQLARTQGTSKFKRSAERAEASNLSMASFCTASFNGRLIRMVETCPARYSIEKSAQRIFVFLLSSGLKNTKTALVTKDITEPSQSVIKAG